MQLIFLVINFRRAGKKASKSTILRVKQPQIPIIPHTKQEAGSSAAEFCVLGNYSEYGINRSCCDTSSAGESIERERGKGYT